MYPNVGKYTIHGLYGIYTYAARDVGKCAFSKMEIPRISGVVFWGLREVMKKRQMVDVGVT